MQVSEIITWSTGLLIRWPGVQIPDGPPFKTRIDTKVSRTLTDHSTTLQRLPNTGRFSVFGIFVLGLRWV